MSTKGGEGEETEFTLLIYLSDGPGHDELGTDIYASKDEHVGRSPFAPNYAMIFVPSTNTWHGFEKRPIALPTFRFPRSASPCSELSLTGANVDSMGCPFGSTAPESPPRGGC